MERRSAPLRGPALQLIPPISTDRLSAALLLPPPPHPLTPSHTVCILTSLNGSNTHRVPIPLLRSIWHVVIIHSHSYLSNVSLTQVQVPEGRLCFVHTLRRKNRHTRMSQSPPPLPRRPNITGSFPLVEGGCRETSKGDKTFKGVALSPL